MFVLEHARLPPDGRDLHRGPARLFQRRGQELLRRHERETGLREGLRRPHRPLQAGGQKATQRTKVGERMDGLGKICYICYMSQALENYPSL